MFWTTKLILSDRSYMKEVATDFISENHLKNKLYKLSIILCAPHVSGNYHHHINHDSDKSYMKEIVTDIMKNKLPETRTILWALHELETLFENLNILFILKNIIIKSIFRSILSITKLIHKSFICRLHGSCCEETVPTLARDSIYNCDYSRDVYEAFLDFAHVTFASEHRNTNAFKNWELTHKILCRNINTT